MKLGLLKGKGLFFVNTTDGGYRLKLFLEQFHIRSAVLNAELPLRSRLNIIEQFNVGNFDYLIATDESTDAKSHSKNTNDDDDEEDETMEEMVEKSKRKKKRKKDSEYGVSRGLDFRGVSFVVNVDFPQSPDSYTHRIGRTARGGAKGVALSLVDINSMSELDMLAQVQESQPPLPAGGAVGTGNDDTLHTSTPMMEEDGTNDEQIQNYTPQPTPLDFDLKEIEGFRYRVEDVSRAVTKAAVRETKAAEVRAEVLNSERLQNHFAENPSDLQLLRHDRQATHISKVQDHLKNVPKYLLPRGMQVANQSRRKRRRRNNHSGNRNKYNQGGRRMDNDPLQSYDGENINLDSVEDGSGGSGVNSSSIKDSSHNANTASADFDDPLAGVDDADDNDYEEDNGDDYGNVVNRSTAGSVKWQERRKRGKFSKKYQKKQKDQVGF